VSPNGHETNTRDFGSKRVNNDMKRLIQRDKGKAHILQMMCRDFFSSNDCQTALVEIREDKLSRSQKQNALYWIWIDTIGGELGYTKDETHMLFRDKFLGYNELTTKKGEQIRELRSTTKLKVGEMKDYLEQIDMFVAEWGIVLPHHGL
jgi:hypothetical protein